MLRNIPAGSSLLRRLVFGAFFLCVLQPFPDGRLFPRSAFCRFFCFLSAAAVIDNLVDHAVVILQGHFRCVQGIVLFRLHRDCYDLPAMLMNCVPAAGSVPCISALAPGTGRRNLPRQVPPPGKCLP